MLGTTVAKIITQYSTFMLNKGGNHCIKECNFIKLIALNVGCKVMLLKNSPSEYKLVNGSIGTVKEIIFEHKNGPRHIPYKLLACVIVEFKESNFSEEIKWRTDLHQKKSFQLLLLPFVVRENVVLSQLFHEEIIKQSLFIKLKE